jgi:ABC-type antimicrobial peptide transport system permease subunit
MVKSIYFLKPAWCGTHFAGLWPEQGFQPVTSATAFQAVGFTFAVIALLLTIVGLYGVVSHSVARRIREIGVRMAVGATPADIVRLVMMQGFLPSGGGLAVGLVGCMGVTRVLNSQLIHVTATDPVTLAAASIALMLPALLGCLIPALRAMRLDPVAALRSE